MKLLSLSYKLVKNDSSVRHLVINKDKSFVTVFITNLGSYIFGIILLIVLNMYNHHSMSTYNYCTLLHRCGEAAIFHNTIGQSLLSLKIYKYCILPIINIKHKLSYILYNANKIVWVNLHSYFTLLLQKYHHVESQCEVRSLYFLYM